MSFEINAQVPLPTLITECLAGNAKMQQALYDEFASIMYYTCLRYVKNPADAEDVLQEGFIKVFNNLDKFKDDGSFEGWIRKIMSRTALTYLRDNKKYSCHTVLEYTIEDEAEGIFDKLAEKDIRGIFTKLPAGYKKIFHLYVIEGYNHREIAEMLGCSESTSKSQFYRSRISIQKLLQSA